ncbi:MAG: hypothetical protein GY926_07515 [bacterium]|nr:hypothetical protein [bacterium]
MNVMIGIDPRKASHTAVAIAGDEQVLDQICVPATRRRERVRVAGPGAMRVVVGVG